ILLGGAQADTIIGGEADDVLYGGFDIEATGARQYVVRFNTTDFDPAAGIDLTFDADGAGGAGAINVTVQAGEGYLGEGEAALTDFMELFEHLPSLASASPDGRFEAEGAGQWTFETLQHGYITITLSGATTDPDAVEAMLSDFFIKANVDEDGPYLLFRNDTNDDFTVTVGNANSTVEFDSGSSGAADVLEGGAGNDDYIIAYSQLDAMTTIKGLNL